MNTDNAAFRERFWPEQEAASRALVAELACATKFEPTEADMLEVIAEAGEAWGKEEEKRAVAAQAATGETVASSVGTGDGPPRRERNLEREARLPLEKSQPQRRRDAHHWGRLVADFIRTMPVPPKTPPPPIFTQLQAALYLSSVCGVTTAEWLARTLQVNRRHGSVLLSRARDARTRKAL